jgi:hypothetical protein
MPNRLLVAILGMTLAVAVTPASWRRCGSASRPLHVRQVVDLVLRHVHAAPRF